MRLMAREGFFWTDEEDAFFRENYGKIPTAEIAKKVGRTKTAVQDRARRCGIVASRDGKHPSLTWTPEEDAFLRAHYLEWEARRIGNELGKTKNSVIGRANRLGLQSPKKGRIPPRPSQIVVSVPREVDMAGERQKGCQWIEGDPLRGDHTYCGKPLKRGSRFSYCEEHHLVVFRKAIPKEQRQHFSFQKRG